MWRNLNSPLLLDALSSGEWCFKHRLTFLAGTGIPLPATISIARLVTTFTCRVTLVGALSSSLCQVCPRLPSRHSFLRSLERRFQTKEYRSFVLSARQPFPDPAPSLCQLTGKGLMPLSWLSCSSSAFKSAERRSVSDTGWSVLPRPDSPRQHALMKPDEPCTRLALTALVSVPLGDLKHFASHPL